MFNIAIVNKLLDAYFHKYSAIELSKKSIAFGVFISLFLIAIKMIAWLISDSISMQASMNDSILDALTSFAAFHALRVSDINHDENHNFGHEKVEGIAALFQCLVVIYSGLDICHDAYEMLLDPKPITNTTAGLVVMAIACVAVYQLIYFQKYVAAKTESLLVSGDSLHYVSDFLMNICIMVSLLLSTVYVYVDAICGLVVGVYVLYNAVLILKNALIDLMDEALPLAAREKIENTIKSVQGVQKISVLRTRSAGMKKYVEAIIVVDSKLSIEEANNICENTELALKKLWDKVDTFVKAQPK